MKTLTFDRVLNVLLLVAVVYGLTMLRSTAPAPRPGYTAGEQAPAIAGVSYAGAKRTAVLFVRSSCHFCTESMAFYRSLAAQHRVVAISSEPLENLGTYLSENDLAVPRATVTQREWSKLSGTPTIVVVDGAGKVVQSWLGSLSQAQERDVMASLN